MLFEKKKSLILNLFALAKQYLGHGPPVDLRISAPAHQANQFENRQKKEYKDQPAYIRESRDPMIDCPT
jgi:hypothetical protein